MCYSTIIIWTSSFSVALKKLKGIFKQSPVFDGLEFEIFTIWTHAKYLMLFSKGMVGEFPNQAALFVSKHIAHPIISFAGDDKHISFTLFQNGDIVTQYHYENTSVINELGLEKMFTVLFLPKVKNQKPPQQYESYEAQVYESFWGAFIDDNPPKLLKEQLNTILGIHS